jgi:thiol-disulfide isomerase/thioredoxin
MEFRLAFEHALPYGPFLEKFGTADHREKWRRLYEAVTLTVAQRALLAGFQRKMPVVCLAGPWCGDCVNACPIFQKIAEASPQIDLRFINRPQRFDPHATDLDTAVANELSICGAPRVPVLLFLSEDWYECERFGERTLATYRDKVAKMQGLSCPTGLSAPPQDILAANTAEWLTHFERVQFMLLTSPRLQKLHGEI